MRKAQNPGCTCDSPVCHGDQRLPVVVDEEGSVWVADEPFGGLAHNAVTVEPGSYYLVKRHADDPNDSNPEQRDATGRANAEDNAICGWCGRPWDEIEDHDEPCAEDGGQFIGPHQKKIVPATEGSGCPNCGAERVHVGPGMYDCQSCENLPATEGGET